MNKIALLKESLIKSDEKFIRKFLGKVKMILQILKKSYTLCNGCYFMIASLKYIYSSEIILFLISILLHRTAVDTLATCKISTCVEKNRL